MSKPNWTSLQTLLESRAELSRQHSEIIKNRIKRAEKNKSAENLIEKRMLFTELSAFFYTEFNETIHKLLWVNNTPKLNEIIDQESIPEEFQFIKDPYSLERWKFESFGHNDTSNRWTSPSSNLKFSGDAKYKLMPFSPTVNFSFEVIENLNTFNSTFYLTVTPWQKKDTSPFPESYSKTLLAIPNFEEWNKLGYSIDRGAMILDKQLEQARLEMIENCIYEGIHFIISKFPITLEKDCYNLNSI